MNVSAKMTVLLHNNNTCVRLLGFVYQVFNVDVLLGKGLAAI